MTSTVNKKPVILVFDNLERCCMDLKTLLETINDYSENQKFHIIIIADRNKLLERSDEQSDAFSYMEEKVIRRTVRYAPSIDSMICMIAEEIRETANGRMPYVNDYYAFIDKYGKNLSSLIYKYKSGDLKDFVHVNFRMQIPVKRSEFSEMNGAAIPMERRSHSDTNSATFSIMTM